MKKQETRCMYCDKYVKEPHKHKRDRKLKGFCDRQCRSRWLGQPSPNREPLL